MNLVLARLAAWLFETALQALLLSLFLIASHGSDEDAFGRDLSFLWQMVILLFFTTGYLFSTVILRAIWRGWNIWLHPIILAALFLTHFEMLNVRAGGVFEPPERFRVRIAGTCIAFVCALAGGWFLRKLTRVG